MDGASIFNQQISHLNVWARFSTNSTVKEALTFNVFPACNSFCAICFPDLLPLFLPLLLLFLLQVPLSLDRCLKSLVLMCPNQFFCTSFLRVPKNVFYCCPLSLFSSMFSFFIVSISNLL